MVSNGLACLAALFERHASSVEHFGSMGSIYQYKLSILSALNPPDNVFFPDILRNVAVYHGPVTETLQPLGIFGDHYIWKP